MATPPLSDDVIAETVAAYIASGRNQVATSSALGISRGAVQDRLKMAARRGMLGTSPVIPGFEISRISTRENADGDITSTQIQQRPERGESVVPAHLKLSGLSLNISPTGEIQRWEKYHEGRLDHEEIADRIIAKYDAMQFAVPTIPSPETVLDDLLVLLPLADLHLGLYAHKDEVGENWDLAKAVRTYTQAFKNLLAMTPNTKHAIILGGGDQMHSDNNSNRTETSGHSLDVDGRYDKVLTETQDLFLNFISLALQKHETVTVRILKGNHDPQSSSGIVGFLRGAFRLNPRVTLDTSPNKFWTYQHGKVMLAATHGDMAKPKQMPGIMAARWPEMWGATKYRYAHCFHVHHKEKIKDELGGAYVETYQSPAPQDAWHYGMGFLSGRSFEAVTYHSETGWRGNLVEPISP